MVTLGIQRAPTLKDRHYHINAVYAQQDVEAVQDILLFLRRHGYRVYDPAEQGTPGRSVYDVLTEGIDLSRVFLVFLSKHFLKSERKKFEQHMITTATWSRPGMHRIITVMIQSCKIPRLLRAEMCVYAWRYSEDRTAVHQHVINALQTPHSRLRTKQQRMIWKSRATESKNSRPISNLSVIFNFQRVLLVLRNCILQCSNEGCNFRRHGRDFVLFYQHLTVCTCRLVQCKHTKCRQMVMHRSLRRHLQICLHRNVQCSNKCGTVLVQSQLKDHEKLCPLSEDACPNTKYGCRRQVLNKDLQKHLQLCEFGLKHCDQCLLSFKREDLTSHHCDEAQLRCYVCQQFVTRKYLESHLEDCGTLVDCDNEGCNRQVRKGELSQHKQDCKYTKYPCQNVGCLFISTEAEMCHHKERCPYRKLTCEECSCRVTFRDLEMHRMNCDTLTMCETCGVTLPRSSLLTHEHYLCAQQSFVSFCQICKCVVPFAERASHKTFHQSDVEDDRRHTGCPGVAVVRDIQSATASKQRSQSTGDHGTASHLAICLPLLSSSAPTTEPDFSLETLILNTATLETPQPKNSSADFRKRSLSSDDSWEFPNIKFTAAKRNMIRQTSRLIDTNMEQFKNNACQ